MLQRGTVLRVGRAGLLLAEANSWHRGRGCGWVKCLFSPLAKQGPCVPSTGVEGPKHPCLITLRLRYVTELSWRLWYGTILDVEGKCSCLLAKRNLCVSGVLDPMSHSPCRLSVSFWGVIALP